jgi:glycosyltransferase involved in cell wall biosynthesis
MNALFDDPFHAKISPIEENIKRPLWTVIIPTYNCAHFLKETIESVLIQNLGPELMQIIVVDDYSTKDDPEFVVRKYGNNRIQFIRQQKNVGKADNYAVGLHHSLGHFIHILHGDDIVLPGFYNEMELLFKDYPVISAGFCQSNYINENGDIIGNTGLERTNNGILENWINTISVSQRIQPPSIVIKREVYEQLGGYDNRLKYFEDWEMYTRIANYYSFGFHPSILAAYRVHQNSSSQTSIRKGERIKTLKLVINIIAGYLPKSVLIRIKKPRNQAQAQYLIQYIPQIIYLKDIDAYFSIISRVILFSFSLRSIYYIYYFSIHWKKLFNGIKLKNDKNNNL